MYRFARVYLYYIIPSQSIIPHLTTVHRCHIV
uniref:Uncharacterized protein n=1 Tax=Podoviridae sp. ct9H612 TaxID=2825226 RepID=A0A8S5VIW3_9CAUD|nr:MAG TPA: hypothetical protein [Podoviridae sp. ct9H612]